MIGQTVSHYRIDEKIGEGGMGVVYRAEDLRLKRPVALKFHPAHLVADPRAKERFLREAQAASALDHPNICVIYEIDETADGELTEDGVWKILDFGIAKLADTSHLTRIGRAVGTVAYMSPKQADRDEVSPQSDLWSLGVVLYEMLAGLIE